MSMETYYENYLSHHGIRGQRWGKKNGPPYPLSPGDHSASEKKAGWRKSLDDKSDKDDNNGGFHLTDKQKKALIIAGVATAAVAGGIVLYKTGAINPNMITSIGRGQKFVGNSFNQSINDVSIDPKTGFNKIIGKESPIERLKRCNPNYKNSLTVTPYNMNCGNSVIANELRCRGLDVQARGNIEGMTIPQFGQMFGGMKSETFCELRIDGTKELSISADTQYVLGKFANKKSEGYKELKDRAILVRQQIEKQLNSQYPDNSRGSMFFTTDVGSHWISWNKANGKILFENPQDPGIDLDIKYFSRYAYHRNNSSAVTTALRLDDLSINNVNIKEVVMNRGNKIIDKNVAKNQQFRVAKSIGDNFIFINKDLV